MSGFKVTSWNVEWLIDHFDVASGVVQPGSKRSRRTMPSQEHAAAKLDAIRRVISEIDPDILLLIEAIPGPDRMLEFVAQHLPDYRLVTRGNVSDAAYHIQGEQWIWFVMKPAVMEACGAHLLDVGTWQAYTREIYTATEARKEHKDGQWWVSAPSIITVDGKKTIGAPVLKPHSHYRHPQVLVLDWKGARVEFVGVHLKSKHIGMSVPRRKAGESDKAYYSRADVRLFLANAAIARMKLTTEATDVRHYIDRRFEQEVLPAIFVLGDVNDGPGKELVEREHLLHDLIGNLQGDVFFARRFLNHALFDNPQHLRWTSRFEDELEPGKPPEILLDHIVFTEALSRRVDGALRIQPHAGLVEHEIFERISTQMPSGTQISDHRPVSLYVNEAV
ncbi:endonuclease/exonuclease/phosphatase family protein [Sinorhizobium meliloti]|uniref:endonuclease/exonuclease/phosphatase family protein n=1 Tax=Rhizobium meliloti TaxID=382 RepID=UPI000FD9C33B|nr:endonuclease/exonuclease/phosphatase family protein [Sinorhizobium meliloti]RVK42982.1 endonuclease/exonuclease/phosphatase family protein [Sinorhizobium meliloti]